MTWSFDDHAIHENIAPVLVFSKMATSAEKKKAFQKSCKLLVWIAYFFTIVVLLIPPNHGTFFA